MRPLSSKLSFGALYFKFENPRRFDSKFFSGKKTVPEVERVL